MLLSEHYIFHVMFYYAVNVILGYIPNALSIKVICLFVSDIKRVAAHSRFLMKKMSVLTLGKACTICLQRYNY
jgi:hypothetical protein